MEPMPAGPVRLPLGMTENVEYSDLTVSLQSGDTLLFFTDGVPEAMNDKNEMFGFDRLEAILKRSTIDQSAKELAGKVIDHATEFTGSAKQHDDMTVVVVKVQ